MGAVSPSTPPSHMSLPLNAGMTLTVLIDDAPTAHVALPLGRYIVGRHPDSCVLLDEAWVSRTQAEIVVLETGWVVTNGFRTRMKAESNLIKAEAGLGGAVWVPTRGTMRLWWPELPHDLVLQVNATVEQAAALPLRPGVRVPKLAGVGTVMPQRVRPVQGAGLQAHLRERLQGLDGESAPGDQLAERPFELFQKQRLAVLFRHEILGNARPRNLYAVAATSLGVSQASLKQLVHRTLQRLNRGRAVPLASVHALGHYLVHTAEELTADDLPDSDSALPR